MDLTAIEARTRRVAEFTTHDGGLAEACSRALDSAEDVPLLLAGVKAVLELHKPYTISYSTTVTTACSECNDEDRSYPTAWPCDTVKALGVTGR